jgi:hypothetical protein
MFCPKLPGRKAIYPKKMANAVQLAVVFFISF